MKFKANENLSELSLMALRLPESVVIKNDFAGEKEIRDCRKTVCEWKMQGLVRSHF